MASNINYSLFVDRPMEQVVPGTLPEQVDVRALVELLNRVNFASDGVEDETTVLANFLTEICKYANWEIGHVYVRDEISQDTLKSAKIWHFEDQTRFFEFQEATENTKLDFGTGLPGRVLKSGRSAWIAKMADDDNFPRGKLTSELSNYSGFALPIEVYGEIFAIFEFYSEKSEALDKSLLNVIDNIGLQLGRNIERLRADKLQKGYGEVLERLATGGSQEDVLRLIVDIVERSQPRSLCSILLLSENGQHLGKGVAPSLPDFYNQAVEAIQV